MSVSRVGIEERETVNAVSLSRLGIEIWVQVPGYEGWYEVSNLGSIRSVQREIKNRPGLISIRKSKILKSLGGEYYRVVLCKNHERKTTSAHQLVLLAFIGPCPKGMEVRHLDDIKNNNKLYNLVYGTRVQNRQDRIKNGRDHRVGLRCSTPKLTESNVLEIRKSNLGAHVLAKRYAVSSQTIHSVKSRKTWKHLQEV